MKGRGTITILLMKTPIKKYCKKEKREFPAVLLADEEKELEYILNCMDDTIHWKHELVKKKQRQLHKVKMTKNLSSI